MSKIRTIDLPLICQGMEISIPLENIYNKPPEDGSVGYTANDVVVSVSIPEGLIFNRSNLPKGTYDPNSQIWSITSLAIGEKISGELIYNVVDDCKSPFKINYTVGTLSGCEDPSKSNNAACTLITGLSCCEIKKCDENLAKDNYYVVPQDGEIHFDVSINDENCPLELEDTYTWVEGPFSGKIDGDPDTAVYKPNIGFCGIDYAIYEMYCNGVLRDTAKVHFNITCGNGISDKVETLMNTPVTGDVSKNDTRCINGGTTSYILVTNPLAEGDALEDTDQDSVKVIAWDPITGQWEAEPFNDFIGHAKFHYILRCTSPEGSYWESDPIEVDILVIGGSAEDDIHVSGSCLGNVLDNDSRCNRGITTVVLKEGSEVNCEVVVHSSGTYILTHTDVGLPWEFTYQMFCSGNYVSEGKVEGSEVTASAVDISVDPTLDSVVDVNIGSEITECNQGSTKIVVNGQTINVENITVSEDGIIAGTVIEPGIWEIHYDIVCINCGGEKLISSGIITGELLPPSSSMAPSSSMPPSSSVMASSSVMPSSSETPSSSVMASSSNSISSSETPSSSAPVSSNEVSSSNIGVSSMIVAPNPSSSTPAASSSQDPCGSQIVFSNVSGVDVIPGVIYNDGTNVYPTYSKVMFTLTNGWSGFVESDDWALRAVLPSHPEGIYGVTVDGNSKVAANGQGGSNIKITFTNGGYAPFAFLVQDMDYGTISARGEIIRAITPLATGYNGGNINATYSSGEIWGIEAAVNAQNQDTLLYWCTLNDTIEFQLSKGPGYSLGLREFQVPCDCSQLISSSNIPSSSNNPSSSETVSSSGLPSSSNRTASSSRISTPSSSRVGVSSSKRRSSSNFAASSSNIPSSSAAGISSSAVGVSSSAPGISSSAPGISSSAPGISSSVPAPSSSAPGVSSSKPPLILNCVGCIDDCTQCGYGTGYCGSGNGQCCLISDPSCNCCN